MALWRSTWYNYVLSPGTQLYSLTTSNHVFWKLLNGVLFFQLLKFVPTTEEIQMLSEYGGEVEHMAKADRFLYDMSR